ncbi:MAG: N-6 DNA methylase [Polaromonas sp. 39-63-203]|jgi:type I restriction enzyme M protein|uniref:type I restriction-modification system subunit M n=1 Tax=Polaromonas sp. TaxID=1869339 RepID=UPI000BC702D9|nr:class I SAM-dependent DNA methyltransferase [Polaromonas sp.]OYY53078.1 MAG: N-6 DNA methylase [Polaromonas sp. 35-63-240]OYY99339.1 MAG: N-6 DNA methylase [Polaromonas sp. 28-63-22]OYZ84143.1 MAG: N-6 DNA methylase [Polaromonas sp. 24-62-144]OZA99284.1 MAG: N-6 DNA methylase [Polaromonas sp. 39-63-203]HQS32550.1 class I SAM-dependent DNA methyltransferase [Polaromonas sp.]
MNKEQLKKLEADLWRAADSLRANSDLKASEYSTPVLGLIFLKFADNKYRQNEAAILAEYQKLKGGRREEKLSAIAIRQCGFYLPDHARYGHLLNLPEKDDIANALKKAMQAIEEYKPELAGVLPQDEYFRLTRSLQNSGLAHRLLKIFSDIPLDAGGDLFGKIYEYFLANFAMSEGQGGGEFFTPRSVVKLMVEIIEPHGGKVFDPACGSGGMFVQSAEFIAAHRGDHAAQGKTEDSIYVYGQEKTLETVKLAKMNLAVNGLHGSVMQANTYVEDPHGSLGQFDYVMANPPFNVDDVAVAAIEKDPRFNTFGLPRNKTKLKKSEVGLETVPNANYLWINLFATSLKPKGRAALVMANSASDARHSEADIRKALIEANLIYGMLTMPSNMFYSVTLPATLWFFDKGKTDERILFIDTRNIFTQIDRAHREFSDEQVANIAIISQLHKGRRGRFVALVDHYFAQGVASLHAHQVSVEALCAQLFEALEDKAARKTVTDLKKQWSSLAHLEDRYAGYLDSLSAVRVEPVEASSVKKYNTAQHQLRAAFTPFFTALHADLKALDKTLRQHEKQLSDAAQLEGKRGSTDRKTKLLKTALEALHAEVKESEVWFSHILWLQERFPKAEYEDVAGLCKLATRAEVEEQDWSLNPGRYVGVVIEEDGKTEEEFISGLLKMNGELTRLNMEARALEDVITGNVMLLAGEE